MGYEKEDIYKQSSPREWASFLLTKRTGSKKHNRRKKQFILAGWLGRE